MQKTRVGDEALTGELTVHLGEVTTALQFFPTYLGNEVCNDISFSYLLRLLRAC